MNKIEDLKEIASGSLIPEEEAKKHMGKKISIDEASSYIGKQVVAYVNFTSGLGVMKATLTKVINTKDEQYFVVNEDGRDYLCMIWLVSIYEYID